MEWLAHLPLEEGGGVSVIVLGPKNPKNKLDVFLQPLIFYYLVILIFKS